MGGADITTQECSEDGKNCNKQTAANKSKVSSADPPRPGVNLRGKSCRGRACDKSPPASKQIGRKKLPLRSKRPLKKNCLNSEDPSCERQKPKQPKNVTKLRKQFRKPFTAFRSQRGPFRGKSTPTSRPPVRLNTNKDGDESDKNDEQLMKNKSNNIDEEERRPKQLKSNSNDGNNDKPYNKGKINSGYKDNNSNNNNIFDEDEEPSPEPEPSHHGDPRHHAFHSWLFQKIDPKVREARRKKFFGRHRRKRNAIGNIFSHIMKHY